MVGLVLALGSRTRPVGTGIVAGAVSAAALFTIGVGIVVVLLGLS
jgi:hypothetical protein